MVKTPIVAGDMGHRIAKAKSAGNLSVFASALIQLDETEFRQIQMRHKKVLPDGYAVVNGIPYAYGDAALKREAIEVKGARRYVPEYYGVLAAISIAHLYASDQEVKYFGSYPSKLVDYREHLCRAVLGEWVVQLLDRDSKYRVVLADAMDEPICGIYNLILTQDAKRRARNDIISGDSLVIDIGGGTTDLQGISKGGEPDYSITDTVRIGINQVIDSFRAAFLSNHMDDFASMDSMTTERVMRAIHTGVYEGAGRDYKCNEEVAAASHLLIKGIKDSYENKAGGATRWDSIVLTGGGSALLQARLKVMLKHDNIVLAEENTENMHLANVNGAYKLAKFYESEGLL